MNKTFDTQLRDILLAYDRDFTPPLDGKDLYNVGLDILAVHNKDKHQYTAKILEELSQFYLQQEGLDSPVGNGVIRSYHIDQAIQKEKSMQ